MASSTIAVTRLSHCPTYIIPEISRCGESSQTFCFGSTCGLLALLHPAVHAVVQDRRLPHARRAKQQHGPAVGCGKQALQLAHFRVAERRSIQIIGIEPVEAAADLLQFLVALHLAGPPSMAIRLVGLILRPPAWVATSRSSVLTHCLCFDGEMLGHGKFLVSFCSSLR